MSRATSSLAAMGFDVDSVKTAPVLAPMTSKVELEALLVEMQAIKVPWYFLLENRRREKKVPSAFRGSSLDVAGEDAGVGKTKDQVLILLTTCSLINKSLIARLSLNSMRCSLVSTLR